MDCVKIQSGEYIGLHAIAVNSIPHISILTEDTSAQNQVQVFANQANDFVGLLVEVYQQYKEISIKEQASPDISLELCWKSTAVENQPYKADIHLFVVLRAISKKQNVCLMRLKALGDLVKTVLRSEKYEVDDVATAQYSSVFNDVINQDIKGIVKEEWMEDLQNSYLPVSYAYDRFPTSYGDLSRIANILIDNPNCAVLFQVIPTYYNLDEQSQLSALNQNIGMLNHGIADNQIGTVSISAADRIAALYHYYSDNKSRALFCYNIIVCAPKDVCVNVTTRVSGQLNSSANSVLGLRLVSLTKAEIDLNKQGAYIIPWVANDILLNRGRNHSIWNSGMAAAALYRLPLIITAEEAASFFRLPIGNEIIGAGLNVNEAGKCSRTYAKNLINAGDIELGKLRSASNDTTIGLTLKDLVKHMLIVGTPGSGKTTFSVGLLDRLWKEHHIPFLVIEPAKNEYRALIQSIPDLQVFTPGKNFISPFVFNPFVPPKNVRLETYKSTLKTAFAAGVSMSTPLDKIFEETVNNCYSDFRWLDSYTIDNQGKIFNITDFIKCFQETFDEIGYTGDARNIGRAGLVRLQSLVNLFDNYFSIPIEDLLSKPTVIELAAIENADQKALIISLLLLSILSYVNANYVGEGGLRNFILLEEAHVLLDANTNDGGEGSANPAAIAQGLVKRMLAEIRSYGVGLAIADQSPRKVGTDIVALTDIKAVFRLVEGQDKEIIANATSMNDVKVSRMAKLKPGEAFLFFNRLDEPEEIITPDYRLNNEISISLSDDGIRQLSTYWSDKQEKLRPYPECTLCPYCADSCDYNRRILSKEVARRIFRKYVGKGCKDAERMKSLLRKITTAVKEELNDEPFSRELLSCIKVYLWRHVKYDTKLNVSNEIIENSLSKK